MKILITGGAGFVGSHIAQALLKENIGDVIVYDNLSVGKIENIPVGCNFINGDIRDAEKLVKSMDGVDAVFHNAAFVSIRGSYLRLKDELDINCNGTLNVLESMVKKGVKKIIFASSMAVYGCPKQVPVMEENDLSPLSPYGFSKARGELFCKIFAEQYGISYGILRYFNIYGIRQTVSPYVGVLTTFINQALNKKPLTIYGSGNQTRDFVHVQDVANANLLALSYESNGIFNIGSGTEESINKLADIVNNYLDNVGKIYKPAPKGEVDRIRADIRQAQACLKYNPGPGLQSLLPEIIKWWKQNY